MEVLQSDLSSVQMQQNRVDEELGGRRDYLAGQEKELRVSGTNDIILLCP